MVVAERHRVGNAIGKLIFCTTPDFTPWLTDAEYGYCRIKVVCIIALIRVIPFDMRIIQFQ